MTLCTQRNSTHTSRIYVIEINISMKLLLFLTLTEFIASTQSSAARPSSTPHSSKRSSTTSTTSTGTLQSSTGTRSSSTTITPQSSTRSSTSNTITLQSSTVRPTDNESSGKLPKANGIKRTVVSGYFPPVVTGVFRQ